MYFINSYIATSIIGIIVVLTLKEILRILILNFANEGSTEGEAINFGATIIS
jgi:hypothetical protein